DCRASPAWPGSDGSLPTRPAPEGSCPSGSAPAPPTAPWPRLARRRPRWPRRTRAGRGGERACRGSSRCPRRAGSSPSGLGFPTGDAGRHQLAHLGQELIAAVLAFLEDLLHVPVEPFVVVAGQVSGRDDDDWNRPPGLVAAERGDELEAVHLRHHQVEQAAARRDVAPPL